MVLLDRCKGNSATDKLLLAKGIVSEFTEGSTEANPIVFVW